MTVARGSAPAARVLVLGALLAMPESVAASLAEANAGRENYEAVQEWRFAKTGERLPAAGHSWTIGSATFELAEGQIHRAQPMSTGQFTGFRFQGRGRITVKVEDPVELRQLGRFMETDVEAFESDFTELVVRSNVPMVLGDPAVADAAVYEPDSSAIDRRDHWLRIRRFDADARLLAALINPVDSYFRADFLTREHGWITLDFDPARHEELHLSVFRKRNSIVERWLALDVEEDSVPSGSVRLEHFDCSARLVKAGKDAIDAQAGHVKLIGEFSLVSRFRAGRTGDRAIRLKLHPMAKVLDVRDVEGRSLPFLRDNIGLRTRALDKRVHVSDLVVLLADPTIADGSLELQFDYQLEVANYMPGRSWYPTGEALEQGPVNRHTALLTVQIRDDFDVRAMGEQEDDVVDGSLRTAIWRVTEPAKMITFATTRKMEERTVETGDDRKVIVFGPPVGDDRLEATAADVARSIGYFETFYDAPLASDVLYATLIQAGHGQAFEGFLHLTEESAFRSASRGVVELFLAHEVAHQWWGHMVGWDSYRDQWLSEGLAQYAAMMFVEAEVLKGDKIFREVVAAYRDELIGSMNSSMSHFTNRELIDAARVAQDRIGPIGHGVRAATAEAPNAYYMQTYRKGALVAHMLRGILSFQGDGEEVFKRVMRGFVERYRGGAASTSDLAEEVARQAPGDWRWFFEQWVDRAEIPTYRWNARIGNAPSGEGDYPVELKVRRQDVAEDFKMYVPVEADLAGGGTERVLILVDEDEESFQLSFAERPRKITFNPEAAVLARTERSKK